MILPNKTFLTKYGMICPLELTFVKGLFPYYLSQKWKGLDPPSDSQLFQKLLVLTNN